jgi:hypothetical protein
MTRRFIAVAAASLLTAAGLSAATAPATAAPAPKDYGTGAAWNADPAHKQKAADPGPIIPGVNAGAVGTDMEGIPAPVLDYASTAQLAKERPAMLTHPKGNSNDAVTLPTGGTAGRAKPVTGPLARDGRDCPGVCYWWAEAEQTGISPVVTSHYWTQRVPKPGLGSDGGPDGHTLAEGIVQNSATGDTIEIGTTVSSALCGSTGASPCIFVFNWVGTTPGCYNGCGFANASGCNPCMGTSVTAWQNTSKIFSLNHLTSPAHEWCAAANNQWVACILDSDWTSSRFVSGNVIQQQFEVAAYDTTPDTDMGDSNLANCSTPVGSYFINGSINGTTTPNFTGHVSNKVSGGGAVNTLRYNACLMPGFTNYWRGGGPGWPFA